VTAYSIWITDALTHWGMLLSRRVVASFLWIETCEVNLTRSLTDKCKTSAEMIDKNSPAWKNYQKVLAGLTSDLGGEGRLSTVKQVLVSAFSAAAVRLNDLAARQMLGDHSILQQKSFAQTVGALTRIAEKLGVKRRPKEIGTLSTYLKNGKGDSDTVDAEIINE
jgi:hypothetical protein